MQHISHPVFYCFNQSSCAEGEQRGSGGSPESRGLAASCLHLLGLLHLGDYGPCLHALTTAPQILLWDTNMGKAPHHLLNQDTNVSTEEVWDCLVFLLYCYVWETRLCGVHPLLILHIYN